METGDKVGIFSVGFVNVSDISLTSTLNVDAFCLKSSRF